MNFNEAIKLINTKYETSPYTSDVIVIETNKLMDEFSTYFIALKQDGDSCFLTDYAKTCEVVDIEEDKLKQFAKNHSLTFNNFYIKCRFNSMQDLENFISFLDEIKSIY